MSMHTVTLPLLGIAVRCRRYGIKQNLNPTWSVIHRFGGRLDEIDETSILCIPLLTIG